MSEPWNGDAVAGDPPPAHREARPGSALDVRHGRRTKPDVELSADQLPSAPFTARRGKGFANPGLLAGGSLRVRVYLAVLVLAAAADLANFYQIVQFAMRDQGDLLFLDADELLAITVVGFTACVLFLAHISGVLLRDVRAGEAWIPKVLAWLCLAVWACLGLAGLYLRATTVVTPTEQVQIVIEGQPETAAPSPQPATTPPSSPSAPERVATDGSAALFLVLYLGTGLAAIVGGYLTHNPAHAALKLARKRETLAVDIASESARESALRWGEVQRLEQLDRHADVIAIADQAELRYQASVLKVEARLRAAQGIQEAAFTDAAFPAPPESSPKAHFP